MLPAMIPLAGHNKTFTLIAGGITLLALIVGVWLLFANRIQPDFLPGERVTIATTIFPLADIAQRVGGEYVHVVQLLPPGADPHSYSPTPGQLAQLERAQAVFIIGHGLDNWAAEAARRVTDANVVSVDAGIELHEFGEEHEDEDEDHGEEGEFDPHYWLTVPNAQQIAATIASTLSEIDPANTTNYQLQTTNYLQELDDLERELQTEAASAAQKHFIAVHDAWSYLAEHYGFTLAGTYERIEGREPALSDLQELQSIIREHDIRIFYTEPVKQSTATTRFFERELNLEIRVLDDIGGLPPQGSYIDLMRENIRGLTEATSD